MVQQCRLIFQLVAKDMRNLNYSSQNYVFQGCEKRIINASGLKQSLFGFFCTQEQNLVRPHLFTFSGGELLEKKWIYKNINTSFNIYTTNKLSCFLIFEVCNV